LEKSIKNSFTSRLLVGEGNGSKGIFRYKDTNQQRTVAIKKLDHNSSRNKKKIGLKLGS